MQSRGADDRTRGRAPKPSGDSLPGAQPASPEAAAAKRLCCARCARPITSEEESLEVDGAHLHTRMNPAGVVFRFRCFRHASGCEVHGESTSAHSWFAGYVWQYAHCGGCGFHLGWYFEGAIPFFGLVAERLVLPS